MPASPAEMMSLFETGSAASTLLATMSPPPHSLPPQLNNEGPSAEERGDCGGREWAKCLSILLPCSDIKVPEGWEERIRKQQIAIKWFPYAAKKSSKVKSSVTFLMIMQKSAYF